jgi:hypothetical protein
MLTAQDAVAAFSNTPTLRLPARRQDAPPGRRVAAEVASLDRHAREQRLIAEVLAGNVPDFLRAFIPIRIATDSAGAGPTLEIFVASEYLAVGSDEDHFFVPLSPAAAERVTEASGCSLPTTRIVDLIWSNAVVRLEPQPIAPSPAMTTLPVFLEHTDLIHTQRLSTLATHPHGVLVAGHKKDLVLTPRIADHPDRVAIYGWHRTNGVPIQPLYTGHAASWVDYSHGVRLVSRRARMNGQEAPLDGLLADPVLHRWLSDEGPFSRQSKPMPTSTESDRSWPSASPRALPWPECIVDWWLDPGVRVRLNVPAVPPDMETDRCLVIYALPNGNSIEETAGRHPASEREWRFGIQHIAAQTRWLRARHPDLALGLAYVEASGRSWPAWRRSCGDGPIPDLFGAILTKFESLLSSHPVLAFTTASNHERSRPSATPDPPPTRVVLAGHSGGGSFVVGCLESLDPLPAAIDRLAFLDANYDYETARHRHRLLRWLDAAPTHALVVLAYEDSRALLDGKPFVSASGGTWGRSRAMIEDLGCPLGLSAQMNAPWQRYSNLSRKVQFLMRENPDRQILHTVQVERNGLIHALEAGTPTEEAGYTYFGSRVYEGWVDPSLPTSSATSR